MKGKKVWIYIGIFASLAVMCGVCLGVGYFVYWNWDQKTTELENTQAQAVQLQREIEDAKGQISVLNQDTAAAQTDYDNLQAQHTALKAKLAQLTSDNEILVSKDAQAIKDLGKAKKLNESRQIDINTANATLDSLSNHLKKVAAYASLTELTLGPVFQVTGIHYMTDLKIDELRTDAEEFLDIIGDPILDDKFEAMIVSGFDDTEEFDFYLYLLESMERVAD